MDTGIPGWVYRKTIFSECESMSLTREWNFYEGSVVPFLSYVHLQVFRVVLIGHSYQLVCLNDCIVINEIN